MLDMDWIEMRVLMGKLRPVAFIECITYRGDNIEKANIEKPLTKAKKALCDYCAEHWLPTFIVWFNPDKLTDFLVQRHPSGPIKRMSKSEYLEFIKTIGGRSLFAHAPDLEETLNFEETREQILIKPIKFLEQEKFQRIYETVKEIGGEWRKDHFTIPKRVA